MACFLINSRKSETSRPPYTMELTSHVILGVYDMQQASCKAEPGDYKHAVNDM